MTSSIKFTKQKARLRNTLEVSPSLGCGRSGGIEQPIVVNLTLQSYLGQSSRIEMSQDEAGKLGKSLLEYAVYKFPDQL